MVNRRSLCWAVVFAAAVGCTDTYYKAWEKLGYAKRDILVSRVEKARDEQTDAKKQFTSTLDQFKALTGFNGGDLEAEYNKLNASYTACKSEAAAVTKKINNVDSVAQAMFTEWTKELDQYTDASLKADSAAKLADSKQRYAGLLAAMRKSEASMGPVLDKFNNYVLYLKHNLNAAAIGSLSNTAAGIDNSVQDLVKQMNASIDEANTFVEHMKKA